MSFKRVLSDLSEGGSIREEHCKRDSGNGQRDIDNDAIFTDFPKKFISGINMALDSLIDEDSFLPSITLTPVKILMCNGADKHEGYPFSKAYCSTDMYDTDYAIGAIFRKGINILIDILQRRIPGNRQHKYVLRRLLLYLNSMVNFDLGSLNVEKLTSLNQTELTTVLVNHLFGKLSASSSFIVDKDSKGKERCQKCPKENIPCPCGVKDCQLSGYFGDTCIGNELVWHGTVDTIINSELIVDAQEDDADVGEIADIPGGQTSVEENTLSLIKRHQIMAKSIVFSFLQKQRHPERDNFLSPCVAISAHDMVIYFYDSFYDILLESSKIPLHGVLTGPVTGSMNLIAVVVSWLVVNHKYLCDGIVDEMKTTKAGFFLHAESRLGIYEKHIKLGGVESQTSHETLKHGSRKQYRHPEHEEMKEQKQMIGLN